MPRKHKRKIYILNFCKKDSYQENTEENAPDQEPQISSEQETLFYGRPTRAAKENCKQKLSVIINEERNVTLERNRLRSLQRVASESPEERERRLEDMRQRASQRLANESIEQRYRRLEDMRKRVSQRVASESDEQREQRLEDMRHRVSQRVASESVEQRYRRLEDMRLRMSQRVASESIEQRYRRLEDMRHRMSQRVASVSVEQREKRLEDFRTAVFRSDTDASGSECDQKLDIPEGREVILRVYRYLQTEYEQLKQLTGHSCDLSPLANILKRTAAATGVSEHTVTSLLEHDQPSDEETFDDDANAKRLRLDIDLDDDLDQKEHVETWNKQIETQTEQEHYGQKEQDKKAKKITVKYDEQVEHNPLKQEQTDQEQTHQEQTHQERTHQEQTHQEQYRATEEQIQDGVRIKQEKDVGASGPSGHILVTCEPVTVKIEPGYCRTTLSVKLEPADQQSSETDLQSLESS